MLAVRIPKDKAQTEIAKLRDRGVVDDSYRMQKKDGFVYVPLTKRIKTSCAIVSHTLTKRTKSALTLKDALKGHLTQKELDQLKRSYDQIGSVAIIESDGKITPKTRLIAKKLLETNPKVTTVLKKASSHKGVFRLQTYSHLAGKKTKEVTYKENNCEFRFHLEKVYFSIRLSNERKRILKQIKKNEEILVMFSGCGVYPIVFSKNTTAKQITGVEINPEGHKAALTNAKHNKVTNCTFLNKDVHKLKLNKRFDRIVMPLPKSADEFLDDALSFAKKGTTIHFYDFLHVDEFHKAREKIKAACTKNKRKVRILRTVRCGSNAPRVFRICVDFKIVI